MATKYEYEIKYGLVRITSCESDDKVIAVPSKIEGKNVYQICEHSFIGLDVVKIILPDTIDKIEDDSFVDLYNLKYFECHNISDIKNPFVGDVSNVEVYTYSSKVATTLVKNYKFKKVSYSKDFKWEIIDASLKTARITSFNVRGDSLVFPDEIDGYKIIEINGKVNDKRPIKKIKFPKYLKKIPDKFLKHQENVSITLPKELEEIGFEAFYLTSFSNKQITFPSTLKKICEGAFFNDLSILQTNLIFTSDNIVIDNKAFERRKITFKDNVTLEFIGKENFWNCDILSIYFKKSNKRIGEACFLSSIIENFYGFENIEYLDKYAFCGTKFYKIKSLNLKNIKEIGEACFQASDIEEVFIPKHLRLAPLLFAYSFIKKVEFEKDYEWTVIPPKCFSHCIFLEELNLPKSITTIENQAFSASSIKYIDLENVENFGEKAFLSSDIVEVTLNKVKELKKFVFSGCTNLEKAIINSNKLYYIPDFCFFETKKLKEIIIPESVTSVLYLAFGSSGIEYINLKNVGVIGTKAFFESKLKEIDLSNVVKIFDEAFSNCFYLKKVVLSKDLKYLPLGAFELCVRLSDIDISNIEYFEEKCLSFTNIKEIVFSKNTKKIAFNALYEANVKKLYVYCNSPMIENRLVWNLRKLDFLYVDFDGAIPSNFLSYNSSIKTAIFSEKVKTIDTSCIYFNDNLEKLAFLNPNIKILNRNFTNCPKLESIYIDNEKTFKEISKKKTNKISKRIDTKKLKFIIK